MSAESSQKGPLRRFAARISAIFLFIYRTLFLISILLGMVLAWLIWSGGPSVQVEDNVGLVIAPTGALVEKVEADPFQQALSQWAGEPPAQTAISDVVDAFDRAREDDRIPFVVLKLDELGSAGIAAIDEIARAARRFRDAGKKVYVWADSLTQPQYGLAAQADEIALDPFGAVWIEGYSVYPNYFADLFGKIGVDIEVFRVGEFKSAVEPFIRNDMSDAARRANAAWLEVLWNGYLQRASHVREDVASAVPELLSALPERIEAADGDIAAMVQDAGIVDRLETLGAFRSRMGETVGMDEDGHGSFRQIHFRHYLQATRERAGADPAAPEVRLVTVQGMIVDGRGEPGTAGGDRIAETLNAARRDDKVRAVVLRIDSPGGSVLASERIRRAVVALQDAGKPVVASMATQAASGGYWIAMDADAIYAYDATITGSIGVFGLWMSVSDALEKVGIGSDGVGTTPVAGALRPDRPLGEDMARVLQSGVEHAYGRFIAGVATGREMPEAAVERVAQGRVWSGQQALERGLVDALGGLREAADRAAELAGLEADHYRLTPPSAPRPGVFSMLQHLSGGILSLADTFGAQALLAGWARDALPGSDAAALLAAWPADPAGRYALCECRVTAGGLPASQGALPGPR
ncbi:signal peptide peptidase SppA [Algiphilus sp.]|uniref:signal peptide peptidase SppA n=1 Tax=Algiphilus sp. TaxID=1872431 RepID=UPI003C40DA9E